MGVPHPGYPHGGVKRCKRKKIITAVQLGDAEAMVTYYADVTRKVLVHNNDHAS